MKSSSSTWPRKPSRRPLALLCLVAAACGQAGCGREFFREWANQDVSEVIFEKSRDPRFRIDLFSIDPPAMSRYADPYDPDRPPAPPDDYAAQMLTPVPQNPDNRLIVPLEGTGYLDMLESWQDQNYTRREELAEMNRRLVGPKNGMFGGAGPAERGDYAPMPAPTPPTERSPFDSLRGEVQDLSRPIPRNTTPPPGGPGAQPDAAKPVTPPTPSPTTPPALNPGPNMRQTSPLNVPGRVPSTPPTPAESTQPRSANGPSAKNSPRKAKDDGVRLAAFQDPTSPKPTAPGIPAPGATPAPRPVTAVPGSTFPLSPGDVPDSKPGSNDDPTKPIRIPGDTTPLEVQDLNKPPVRRPDLTPGGNANAEAETSELLGLLGSGVIDFNENEAIGRPRDEKTYIVNMGQALTLALINARVYQFQLENLYLNALPVTLNRFAFSPQFIAGLSPTTGTVGPLGTGLNATVNPANSFLYRTRATGLQQSNLNMGTVAAVGKNLDNGVKILAGFASTVVFNFTGKNPVQPTVNSTLPLNVVVPFLRGGGRAVTLEPLTQSERNLVYAIRSFAKFRQEFVITTIVGGNFANFGTGVATPGFSGGGNSDPTTGYLNVVEDFVIVENQTRNVQTLAQFSEVYKELILGEASGLTQLQLDQLDLSLQQARSQLLTFRNTLRNDLDNLKWQLGLPPDTPLTVDRSMTQPFKAVFQDFERWARDPKRTLPQLEEIATHLPKLEEIEFDGRSATELFRSGDEDQLEELLLAAERVAFENRLDLMNIRAGLYDAWRQIRVSANALKGVFNVNLTNQLLTPPTTSNPFGFVSQAKQFNLVLNAELPLVRLAERNNFRTQLINYQRQRRVLQGQEDFIKNQLRQDVRGLQVAYLQYNITVRNFVLSARQKDQSFENIVAPPAGGGNTAGGNANGAVQTQNLISAQSSLIQNENNLVSQWYAYQGARLTLLRDLGTLPYDEWEAFYELYPTQYNGLGVGGDGVAGGLATGGPSPAPAEANRP